MINKIAYLEPKGKPKQLVVFLHGYGSNKDDLISLSEHFARVLPEALFISPNAPHSCGFMSDGYSWFSLDGVDVNKKTIPDYVKKDLNNSVEELNEFVDKILVEYEISPENIYFIGFSQGATMSIYASIKREVPVKAVLSYSGFCFEKMDVISKPDVVGVVHGKLDDVLPFLWHEENINKLKEQEINAKQLAVDNAYHEIPLEAIEFGKVILKESL
jgi:phospholipase/carboxylesterase